MRVRDTGDRGDGHAAAARLSVGSQSVYWLAALLLVYLLIVAVGLIGAGFKWVSGGAEGAQRIFAFATNPVLGVILGTLATALVQSSSTVTSVIVGLVAGGLPVGLAVPMIMGANMGTTITNTIVSLGNVGQDDAFNRSFSAATVHDFFNLYSIVIFLPIEVLFHPLERVGGVIAQALTVDRSASMQSVNVLGKITKPAVGWVESAFSVIPSPFGALLMIATGIALVFTAVLLLGKVLRRVMTGRAQRIFHATLGGGAMLAILSGAIITILVQSSSTTTSLIVPLAGAGIFTLEQVYPFTLGANIGTCITALLAATAVSGDYQVFALQIALVHLLYNTLGVLFFWLIPFLWNLPMRSAQALADGAERSRSVAIAYVLGAFFVLPGVFLGGQYLLDNTTTSIDEQQVERAEEEVRNAEVDIQ